MNLHFCGPTIPAIVIFHPKVSCIWFQALPIYIVLEYLDFLLQLWA